MKKLMPIFLTGLVILSGCTGEKNVSDYDRIHKRLVEMTGYEAVCEVTYHSPGGEDKLVIKQSADASGRYRLEGEKPEETSGSTILYDGNMLWLYNPNVKSRIKVSAAEKDKRRELILFTFMKNETRAGEEPVTDAASGDGADCIVFEAEIPGGDESYASEKLFVDSEEGNPIRLVIYDSKGEEYISEEFSDFVYNPEFDADEFKIAGELKDKVN